MAIGNYQFVICICYWQFAIENQKSEIGNLKSAIGIGNSKCAMANQQLMA